MFTEQRGSVSGEALEVLLRHSPDTVVFVNHAGRVLLTNREEDEELSSLEAAARSADLPRGLKVLHRDGRPYEEAEWPLARALSSGELIANEEFELVDADGDRRGFSCSCAPFFDSQGDLLGAVAVLRDVTEPRQSDQELERRIRQQAAVAELGHKALEGGSLQSMMDEAVSLVCQTLGVEHAKVGELLTGRGELLVRAGVGWREGVVGRWRMRAGRGSPAGYALLVGGPVIVDDMAAERRFEIPAVLREHRVMSDVTVVIDPRGEAFGTLAASSERPHAFSKDDVGFLQAVANVLASVVERTGSDKRLEAAREAERIRMARDMHDEALSGLADAIVDAQLAKAAASDAVTAGRLERLVPTLSRIGEQLRAAIYDSRLPEEQHRPFPELLEALVALHRTRAVGFEIELDLRRDGVGPLGPKGTQLLRIVGEALTNARRHSGSKKINVTFNASDVGVTIEVSDHGLGFDPRTVRTSDGTGIRGMQERAAIAGATLAIDSRPANGTRVRVDLPLVSSPSPGERLRVLLVDDHASVRQAIASAFQDEDDFEVVAEAGSLNEARQMLELVDVAVIDLALPDGYGGDLITELRERNPEAQALVLTASLDRAETARAIESGAAAVIHKAAQLDQVVADVRRLRAGETLLPSEEALELLRFAGRQREREHQDRRALASLTARERQVLQALADGLDSQQIADRLHIAVRTEQNHVANILAKLRVHSRLQALVFALRYGIVEVR